MEKSLLLAHLLLLPRDKIFTSEKAKSWPSGHNLLVYQLPIYQLLSIVRLSPSQMRPSRYDFYEQKSENC